MTKVDVIIPTYNRAEFIQAALGSVLNQSFRDFTLLVVDDASQLIKSNSVDCGSNGMCAARHLGGN
jgi:GT2 family glycosyltransferase